MINLDKCNFSTTTIQATSVVWFGTFYVLLPYYLSICQILNLLLVAALVRCLKTYPNFVYQLYVAMSKSYENLVWGLFSAFGTWWSGIDGYVPWWWSAYYFFPYFTMCILPALAISGYFLQLFLSVAMAADRVFCLWHPIAYKKIDQRLHRSVALSMSIFLTFALSIDKYWSSNVTRVEKNGTITYGFEANKQYNNALFGQVAESIRTYVRVSLILALIILNVIMVNLYRARMRRLAAMTLPSQEKTAARKEANKDLTILSVCQSLLTCFSQIPHIVINMFRQVSAYWLQCFYIMGVEYYLAIMLATSLEFFLLLAVNKKIRANLSGYKLAISVYSSLAAGGHEGHGHQTH